MLGGRNNISSTAGIQGYGGGVGGGRRHLTQVAPNPNHMVGSPTFTPHSMYSPQHQVDPYRNTNGSASIASDIFPATPYTPMVNLFMPPTMRAALTTPHSLQHRRPVTHVTSSKFNTYTTIYNLEQEAKPSVLFPMMRSQTYQTSARYTGKDIMLRRIVCANIAPEHCATVLESLRQYRHPNLVPLTNIFTTDEFIMGSSDVIMEYRFMPGAKSLQEAFFGEGHCASEGLLWSFTCQLISLLRSFHETLVPLPGIHWSKIIYVETTGRFYFTGLGLADLVTDHKINSMTLPLLMKQDIQSLGLILFQLATHNLHVTQESFNSKQGLRGYSQSFCDLIKTCLESNADAAQLCHALGERMSMEVGHQEGHADYLMAQCSKEMHNGRLMRLMIKLNFVLESGTEVQEDTQRYALRMFNQFLFNQVDDQNRVHVDWGHVYHCLNKLDCGSEETIQLIGTDDANTVLVTSYADLRGMLSHSFEQLQQLSQASGDMVDQVYRMASPGSLQ